MEQFKLVTGCLHPRSYCKGIDYNTHSVTFSRESWGLSAQTNINEKSKAIWLPEGLLIPYYSDTDLIRLRIRQKDPINTDRFIMVAGSSMGYFDYNSHLNQIPFEDSIESKPVVITEAELDGWLIYQEAGDIEILLRKKDSPNERLISLIDSIGKYVVIVVALVAIPAFFVNKDLSSKSAEETANIHYDLSAAQTELNFLKTDRSLTDKQKQILFDSLQHEHGKIIISSIIGREPQSLADVAVRIR